MFTYKFLLQRFRIISTSLKLPCSELIIIRPASGFTITDSICESFSTSTSRQQVIIFFCHDLTDTTKLKLIQRQPPDD